MDRLDQYAIRGTHNSKNIPTLSFSALQGRIAGIPASGKTIGNVQHYHYNIDMGWFDFYCSIRVLTPSTS